MLKYIFLLLTINCCAQAPFVSKQDVIVYAGQLSAGLATGAREEVLYHPNRLFDLYPRLCRNWWDIRVSSNNKDKISPALVAFSDANHFFKGATVLSNCVSIGFCFGELPKRGKFKYIAKKMLLSFVSYHIGFALSYNLIFKNKLYQ